MIPSIKNDFRNASNYLEFTPDGIHLTLSMSFPNLAEPESIKPQIDLLDAEYPGMFTWMGEVNLVKQALLANGHTPPSVEAIAQWSDFMEVLRQKDIPIAIHSDLGNDREPEKYRYLLEEMEPQRRPAEVCTSSCSTGTPTAFCPERTL